MRIHTTKFTYSEFPSSFTEFISFYSSLDSRLNEVIQKFAKEKFGEFGGYAQQYLFYYARENKIGKKTSKNEE